MSHCHIVEVVTINVSKRLLHDHGQVGSPIDCESMHVGYHLVSIDSGDCDVLRTQNAPHEGDGVAQLAGMRNRRLAGSSPTIEYGVAHLICGGYRCLHIHPLTIVRERERIDRSREGLNGVDQALCWPTNDDSRR